MLKTRLFLSAVIVVGTPLAAPAAILSGVPMQGDMVMPMIAYDAGLGRLRVMMPPTAPQLTPLLVSHPGDQFAPDDPWYDFLDPARQGLSFTRRYGFVMAAATDPLSRELEIWLRKLSGSPELGAYRYSGSAPKEWEPVFGTAGTTNAMMWDGLMFHPAFTAPPGTNGLSAVFEAFLVNTVTGEEVPDSSTGPMTLRWTNVPDGRPVLSVATKVVIAWPASGQNYILESAETMPSARWTTVTNEPVMVDGQPAVVLDSSAAKKFFRMRLAP